MATISSFIDGTVGEKHVATVGVTSKLFKTEKTIDFSLLNASAADVVQVLNIPKGAWVDGVALYIDTAEGGVLTADLGDTADPNGWNDGMDLNVAGDFQIAVEGTDAYAPGKLYTADSTIDLTLDNDADTAKVTVVAFYSIIESVANS